MPGKRVKTDASGMLVKSRKGVGIDKTARATAFSSKTRPPRLYHSATAAGHVLLTKQKYPTGIASNPVIISKFRPSNDICSGNMPLRTESQSPASTRMRND